MDRPAEMRGKVNNLKAHKLRQILVCRYIMATVMTTAIVIAILELMKTFLRNFECMSVGSGLGKYYRDLVVDQ